MSYIDRLQQLKLPTLKYRSLRGDMIEVCKITHAIYNSDVSLNLAYHLGSITRGNRYKLLNHSFHYDLAYVSTILLHALLIFGTVYLTMLFM